MSGLLATALVLGIGGLDPTPALILVAALLAGADRRAITVLGLVVLIGAPLYGSVLALTIGSQLADVNWWILVPSGQVGAIAGLAVGLVLLGFGVLRLVRTKQDDPSTRRHRAGTAALIAAGATYVGSLVIDPTFVAVTVLAGRTMEPIGAILMEIAWVLLAQLPLIALLIAVTRVGRQHAAELFQRWWSKLKPVLQKMITAALVLVGSTLMVDAILWFTTGHFLLVDQRRS